MMRNVFNNPTLLYRDGALDHAAYGMLAQGAESFDPIFVDDVSGSIALPLPYKSYPKTERMLKAKSW